MIRIAPTCILLLASAGCKQTLLAPEVDHTDALKRYEGLLRQVVTDDGYVDYDVLADNREPLDAFVAWLAEGKPWENHGVNDRHNIYLNAYNGLVLYQLLERGMPRSVNDVGSLVPTRGAGFFWATQFDFGIERLSLNEIEHERIRMSAMDFRSHAAMNRGARSSPPMRNELYDRSDSKLQRQLREQMNRWVDDDERGVRIVDGIAVFNPMFEWYARDFEFWSAGLGLCELAARYASPTKRRRIDEIREKGCPHEFFEFDWSLHEAD